MSGLVEVLRSHRMLPEWTQCSCGWLLLRSSPPLGEWESHVAAVIEAWLAERLASDEVREAAGDALVEALNVAGWNYATAETAADEGMPAALTAITAALTQGDRR